jgi:hypothetical protein
MRQPYRILGSGVVLPALAILTVLSSPRSAQSQAICSTTQYSCSGTSYQSSEPSGGCSFSCCWGNWAGVSWDFTAGTFACTMQSTMGAPLSTTSLLSTAIYSVTNLPPGTPVVVRFRFTVDAFGLDCPECNQGQCFASGSISISGPGATWSSLAPDGIHVIEMQFDGLAGDSFGITFDFQGLSGSAEGFCGASLNGQIEFYDVPAGAVITPCSGTTSGVHDALDRPTFALREIWPNPAVNAVHVNFSLPDDRPAVLALYDVAGRQIVSREVGGFGAGQHAVTFQRADMSAGIYFVRLSGGGMNLTGRTIFLP